MMPVRLPRTAVLVACLVAVWLVPAPANAAAKHHRTPPKHSCARTPDRCLAGTWHERLGAQAHTRNPSSNDALDDVDDRDLGSDPASAVSVDGDAAASHSGAELTWIYASRAADPLAARLIVWRKLAAPRPPPSL
jgi:hypothetical protein